MANAVTVVTSDPGRKYVVANEEAWHGVRILRMGNRYTVYLLAAWYLVWHGRHYDVVVDVSNGVPFFSALFTSTPTVLFVHHVHLDQWQVEFPLPAARFGRFIERWVVPLVYRHSSVIAVSDSTRADLEALGFRRDAITVILNGLDLPVSSDAPNLLPGPRVLYLGRLKRYKRLEVLIRAVTELNVAGGNLHLDLAGDGDARPGLEALVKMLRAEDQVTFYGFVDDATRVRLYASATVFATASQHEGWGLSVIEANAFGCPAVAYNVPGLRDAIQDGVTGLLAEDYSDFKDALLQLTTDHQLRGKLGQAAEEWASTCNWDTAARDSLELLRRVAHNRRRDAFTRGPS